MSRFTRMPILFAGAVLLLAAGRWGSYLHVPKVPFYIGDAVLLAAMVQAFVAWRNGELRLERTRNAPRLMLVASAFVAWALLRVVTRTALPLVAVRDLAPYAYALAVPLAFLLPFRSYRHTRAVIYGALAFHLAWYMIAKTGLVNPAETWRLAAGATVFSTRPDFDAACFGIAIAFALHQIAFGPRPQSRYIQGAMLAFIGVNGYALGTQHSRSGLLSGFITTAAVLGAWFLRPRSGPQTGRAYGRARRATVATAAVGVVAMTVIFTLPGQRLIEGFASTSGSASGTSNARFLVHKGMFNWLLDSPVRTAVGVGYGPNVLARSKTVHYLEGTEFEGVRSPHDYLLGTWARLGLIGAALAAALILAAALTAVRRLSRSTDPAEVLAALIVIALPVVAMLGVVLESPFGAIPYFWAVGHLCATASHDRTGPTESRPLAASAGAQAQGQLLDG